MLKKTISLILAISLAAGIGLSGCGSGQDTAQSASAPSAAQASGNAGGTTAASPEKPVNLTCWFEACFRGVYDQNAEGADFGDFHRFAAEEYKKLHPNTNIEVVVVGPQERAEKLSVAVQSNEMPDLMFDTHFALFDYAHAGVLLPLNDIITEEDRKDIPPAAWDNVTLKGNTYMFPFTSEDGHMGLNLNLFEQAGAMDYVPKGDIGEWTPEQFRDALRALKKGLPSDVYPLVFYCGGPTGDTWNNMYMRMFGAQFFNDDTTEIILNDEKGVKALEFMLGLQKEGLIAPGSETLTVEDAAQIFLNKKAAVSIFNVLHYNNLVKGLNEGTIQKPFDLKFAYIPNEAGNVCFTYVFGSAAFATGKEDNIAAAKDFIKFYSSPPYTDASMTMLPFRKSVAEKLSKTNPQMAKLAESLQYSKPFNQLAPGYLELRALFFPELQAAFTGQKTAQEALDSFAAKGNEVLKKNVQKSKLLNP
jgi:multiple sugar transport system substrate-binding protein